MEGDAAPSTSKIPAEGPVQVSIVNGEAFVWSAASIAVLRRQYGIVGLLTGSLPLIPQQNAFLGVPLQLFEEEVVYLLRSRAVILVDDTKSHDVDSSDPQALGAWHESRAKRILETRQAAMEEARQTKAKSMEKHATSESARIKKQQREERRQREAADADDVDLHQQPSPATATDDALNLAHNISIPSTSKGLGWQNIIMGENAFDTLSSAARAGLWRYPENADQRARCAAFEALRAKQYYLGKGIRFGGDFVVYPGDPLRYHSHFTATVQTTPQTQISAHELIAAGRLGTAVKKSHLLCSVNEPAARKTEDAWQYRLDGYDDLLQHSWGHVDFISLTWAGFGV